MFHENAGRPDELRRSAGRGHRSALTLPQNQIAPLRHEDAAITKLEIRRKDLDRAFKGK
jgi:hypothetical protein